MPIGVYKRKLKSLIGKRFNHLTITKEGFVDSSGRRHVGCKCDCGNNKFVRYDSLKNNNTVSCGCFSKKLSSFKLKKYLTKHGESKTRLYKIWTGMIFRCSSLKDKDYGKRGIIVCPEWVKSYVSFKEWSCHNGYKNNLTIDRINVNGNYEPTNCRWITQREQQDNRRNTLWITFSGKTKTLSGWASELGIKYHTLYQRLFLLKQSTERAFTT